MKDNRGLPESDPDAVKRSQQNSDEIEAARRDEEDPLSRDGYAVFPAAHVPTLTTEDECVQASDSLRVLGNQHFGNGAYGLALRR